MYKHTMRIREKWLRLTEETNALDYLETAVGFIRETEKNRLAWKWVVLSLHSALYGFAICACQGTDYENVTTKTNKGSSLFSVGDFIDLPAFVAKLRTQQDPISKFLWNQFSGPTQEVLKSATSTPAEQKLALVQALDNILKGVLIYEPVRFAGVALSQETNELKSQNPIGKDLIRLNRLLLEDAYPLQIAKKKGEEKLISFDEALKRCQEPKCMNMLVDSQPLVLSGSQKDSIRRLKKELRNKMEHYVPSGWSIEIHGMPQIAIDVLDVIRFLALETGPIFISIRRR